MKKQKDVDPIVEVPAEMSAFHTTNVVSDELIENDFDSKDKRTAKDKKGAKKKPSKMAVALDPAVRKSKGSVARLKHDYNDEEDVTIDGTWHSVPSANIVRVSNAVRVDDSHDEDEKVKNKDKTMNEPDKDSQQTIKDSIKLRKRLHQNSSELVKTNYTLLVIPILMMWVNLLI